MTNSVGRRVQSLIYRNGALGVPMPTPRSVAALEAAGQRAMSRRAVAYVAGSAGVELTARANRAAFDDWQIVPRMLRDVAAARPERRAVRTSAPHAVRRRPGRRAGARAPGGRRRDGASGRRARRPDGVLDPGVAVDGGVRRGDGRGEPVVPALLEQRRRPGGQLPGAGRGVWLRGARRDPRHPRPRLAAARPGPGLSAVRPGPRPGPVHQRPGLPPPGRGEGSPARRAESRPKPTRRPSGRCSRSLAPIPARSGTTCARRSPGPRSRPSSMSSPGRR